MSDTLLPPVASTAVDRSFLPGLPALDNTYGAVLLGSNFSLILYGITIHQAYQYIRSYPNDRFFVKAVVWLVLALETVNTAMCMDISYWHLVTNYFDPIALTFAGWALDGMPLAAGLSIITAQCFFIRRVYKLGGNHTKVAYATMVLLVTELGFCCAATAEAFTRPSFQAYQSVTWTISAAFGTIVLADLLLTTSLIIALRGSRTGFRRTDSLIDVLILYAITTASFVLGLVTTIINLLALFFALILPNNLIYVGINIVAGKMYVSSLFAALNLRKDLATSDVVTTSVYGTGGAVYKSPTAITTGTWRVAPTVRRGANSSTLNISMVGSDSSAGGGLAGDKVRFGDPEIIIVGGDPDEHEMLPVSAAQARHGLSDAC